MMNSSMAFQLGDSSSSSSPSIHPWNHDVFLSFRGEDVRHNFISHLNCALCQNGIKTYIDNNLERGEEILPALFKAIEGSMISIIVLSKNYAESRCCLDELLKILNCKETMKQIVLPIFYHVDPSEVRHQKGIFGESFDKLGDKLKDKEKMLKWKVALKTVADLSGFPLANFRDDELEFIQKIILWVNPKIVNRTPLSVAKHPIGIESRIRDIYQHLSIEKNDIIRVVGIFGIGGIGKTTISKYIYNQISSQFEGRCFLRNIRETSEQVGGLIQLQNTLLFDILGTKLDISDVDKGASVLRDRFRSKRILLILDDVDELVQLEKLAGDRAWFGSGSRIIITTRDQQLLKMFEVDSEYKLKNLDKNEALRLFSLHAFKKEEPLDDYMELSKQVIKYCQGLPLALTVLGSDLKGQSIYQWKSALGKYKSIPNKSIQRVLQISYDSLEDSEKDIFLDIAFFFKGTLLANVIEIFDSCGFFPVHGIQRLIDKCLISTNHNRIWMHDLLQDMGREILREKSSKDPTKRSRLWFHKDVRQVFEEDHMGPNEIEGIVLDLPKGDEKISLHPEAFRHMKSLRVFINRNAHFSPRPNYLSDKLRVLDWYNYPLPDLPHNFQGKNLIVFRMRHSMIKELGKGFNPKNLMTMAFKHCSYLKEIPNLSSTPNLKELTIECCYRLVKVHDSVGFLEKLSDMSFTECSKLRVLPRSLKLRSLRKLNLRNCSSLRDLPEIECEMESLLKLDLYGTAVEELPLSIGNLIGLENLSLMYCKNLMGLPIASIQLKNLGWLSMKGCTNIVKKMRDDRQSLDLPNDSTTMEDEISNSSNGISTALQVSNLQISCSHSESNFFPLYSFFTMFNFSATLHSLNLSKTEIVSLPTSIKGFVTLTHLELSFCHKLEEILELPPNIREVNVCGCKSLERFREVSKILKFNGSRNKSLRLIELSGCDKMHENIWNDKVQNPLLWKGLYDYDATLFPKNQIPDWFRNAHEFLDNEMEKGPNDDARRRGIEKWAIDIEGPHYLEDISGILLYVVLFFKDAFQWQRVNRDVKITSKGSNRVCSVRKGVELVNMNWYNEGGIGYDVWVGYSSLQCFKQKVLDNLQVQFCLHHGFSVSCDDGYPVRVPFYTSYRAKVVYKNERGANIKGKVDEAKVLNNPQQQLRLAQFDYWTALRTKHFSVYAR